ncbi:MAG: sulfatase [Acidobacteria bacterium]|nr:sulfatase [Acidobacteriota bacterium]
MLNRRQFSTTLAAAPVAFAQSNAPKPNVLFIAVDDLNDWVGCLGGHPQTRAPNLDKLAARGLLFTNAHCNAPLCNPSRASLMTGIRPSTSGVYTNSQPWRGSPVLGKAVTLPQHFRAHGYRAVGGGKIYHGGFPDAATWDEYFPDQVKNKPSDPEPAKRPFQGIGGNMDWGPLNVPDAKMGDAQVVDWAIGEMNKPQSKPLFLGVGLFRPHLPWHVPAKYFDLFPLNDIVLPRVKPDDLADVPPIGVKFAKPDGDHDDITGAGKWKNAVQAYLASIAFMDAQLGRLIDAFDKSPLAKNTHIVLWSDHGWHLGEKLHWRKFSLWEEATRNVMLTVAPGVTKAGSRCNRPVSLIDLYPTLTELCGLPARPGVEGRSLVPILHDPARDWEQPALTTFNRGNHSLRNERWRYTVYSDGGEELYDHHEDPMEWTNLAKRPEYAQVKAQLAKWLPRTNAADVPKGKGVAEE